MGERMGACINGRIDDGVMAGGIDKRIIDA